MAEEGEVAVGKVSVGNSLEEKLGGRVRFNRVWPPVLLGGLMEL
jgi:hypothetical protein